LTFHTFNTHSDMDAVSVAHALPDRFAATLWANDSNISGTSVQYVTGGEHEVVLSPPYVGHYMLTLKLDGARVDIVRRVVVNCGKDKVAIDGGAACGCEAGFEPNTDASGLPCKPCDVGTSSVAGASCGVCASGFFLRDLSAEPSKANCKPCTEIDGVKCGWNATIRTITMQTNYWRLSDLVSDVWPCGGSSNASSSCIGGETTGRCVDGQGGPMCKVCLRENWYYMDGDCKECPTAKDAVYRAIGIFVAVALVLAFVRLLFLFPERVPVDLRSMTYLILRLVRKLLAYGLQPKLKIFVAFYQIMTQFGSTYSVRLPQYYWDWMRYFDFLTFGLDELLGVPAGCLAKDFVKRVLLSAFVPLVAIFMVFVLLALRAGYTRIAQHDGQPVWHLQAALSDGLLWTTPFALLVTFAFVPSVSANIFKAWSCQGFGLTQTENRYYLREDLSIVCYESDAHAEAVKVAIVLMVVWPIGVLVLYAVLLLAARRSLLSRTPTRLARSTSFLHRDYYPECCYFELIDLVRRTVLMGWVLLIDETSSFVRILIGLMFSLVIFTLTVIRRPYRHWEDHYFAVSSQFMIVVSFIGAMAVKLYEDVNALAEQQGVYDLSTAVFGFDSSEGIVNLLLSFTVLMICPLLLSTLVYKVAQEGPVLTCLLRSTHKPPELTLMKGQKYHLFNSRARRITPPQPASACACSRLPVLAQTFGALGRTLRLPSSGSCRESSRPLSAFWMLMTLTTSRSWNSMWRRAPLY
jgi:hypothetical protein